jgi:hypothetical protein
MRPLLTPGLRRFWRDASTIQFGADPARAVVIGGVSPPEVAVLDRLDGRRPREELLAGLEPVPRELVLLLESAGLLVDADRLDGPDSWPAGFGGSSGSARAIAAGSGGDGPRGGRAAAGRRRGAVSGGELRRPDLAAAALARDEPAGAWASLRRRAESRVVVRGGGRVGAPLASLLTAAGLGRVIVEDAGRTRPADVCPAGARVVDVGLPRALAAEAAMNRVRAADGPGGDGPWGDGSRDEASTGGASRDDASRDDGSRGDGPADEDRGGGPAWSAAPPAPIVVLTPIGLPVLDPDEAMALAASGRPHLLAGVRETTAVIGPFVLPGRATCLYCQHLRRRALDPAWPLMAAQMAAAAERADDACDTVLAAAAAALAAAQVLEMIDYLAAPAAGSPPADAAPPATVDGSLEVSLAGPRIRRRSWAAHPRCPCGAAHPPVPAAPATSPPGVTTDPQFAVMT